MKLLDIFGTNRDIFTIGLGTNKVEFRTIDGELYFRNYGGGYEKVTSASLRDSVIPRQWAPETTYFPNEFIIYGGALWHVQTEHSSTVNFSDNLDKVLKTHDIDNFLIYTISAGSEEQLVETSNSFVFVQGSGAGYSIILPSALGLELGAQFLVQNSSVTDIITVKNYAGDTIGDIDPERGLLLTLVDHTSAGGIWGRFSYGGPINSLIVRVPLSPGSLSLGDVLQLNSLGLWELADTNTNANNIITHGILNRIAPGFFDVLLHGEINFENTSYTLTPGTNYYLSTTTPGDFEAKTSSSIYYLFKATTEKKGLFFPRKRTTDLELVGPKTSNYIASSFELVECDTSAGSFTVTLPASPTNNDKIAFIDKYGTFGQNNVILDPGSKSINGVNDTWALDISSSYVELVYSISSTSWYFNEVPGTNYGTPPPLLGASSTFTYPLNGEDENKTFFTIEHNLGYFPLIQILDEDSEVVLAAVRHDSVNEISVNLSETVNVVAVLR